ncbi:hypothetical protein D1872_285160 [compost metagenome]
MQNLQLPVKRIGMCRIAESHLYFVRVGLEVVQIAFHDDAAFVHDGNMVAQVLDFAQIVG